MSTSDSQETNIIAPISWLTFHQPEEYKPVNVSYRTYLPEHTSVDIMDWYRNQLLEDV